ncbi:hypothetical protein RB195_004956 [Necator americanus]|uniref:Uncharacterized protein n=1 Tax=Necator americanus TaxID=51031 RepID=A0ABR1BNV1_NECAM
MAINAKVPNPYVMIGRIVGQTHSLEVRDMGVDHKQFIGELNAEVVLVQLCCICTLTAAAVLQYTVQVANSLEPD